MGAYVPSVRTALNRRGMIALIARAHHSLGQRLGPALYVTPAWDMLLDLYTNDQRRPMSLTSLCLASSISERTALRTIDALVTRNLLIRTPDTKDRRRTNIRLSPSAIRLLNSYFDDLLGHLPRI
jgi:DNA-binding MarR family transcriptional regulator